jgi:protein gp138
MSEDFDDVLGDRAKRDKAETNVCLPGKVTRYDRTLRQADVQPLVKTRVYGEDDLVDDESRSIVCNCPVKFPQTARFGIAMTLAVGDLVTLIYSQESLDDVVNDGLEAGPYELPKHGASDAFCIVGWVDYTTVQNIPPTPDNGISMWVTAPGLGPDDFKIEMDLTSLSAQITVPCDLFLTAGGRIILDAPDVVLNNRRVRLGDEDI